MTITTVVNAQKRGEFNVFPGLWGKVIIPDQTTTSGYSSPIKHELFNSLLATYNLAGRTTREVTFGTSYLHDDGVSIRHGV